MVKVLQVLGKQTNEIRVLSDCLTRELEIVLSLIETINVAVSSSDIIRFTGVLFCFSCNRSSNTVRFFFSELSSLGSGTTSAD